MKWHGWVLLVLLVAAFLGLPAYAEYCESQNANQYYCAAYKMALPFGRFVEAHNGAITALASAAVAWFTWTLWQSSEKMWGVTKTSTEAAVLSAKASTAAIRAVLTVKHYSAKRNIDSAKRNTDAGFVTGYTFDPVVENSGNTHALNCIIKYELRFTPPYRITFDFNPIPGGTPTAVGPRTVISSLGGTTIPVTDAVRVWRGEVVCLLYFRAEYDDLMGDHHHVEACVRIGFRGDPSVDRPGPLDPEFITYAFIGPNSAS